MPIRSPLILHAAAFLLFVAFTILMFPDVVWHLSSRTIGWEGDNLYCIRQMWWMKYALLDLRTSPFHEALTYYPHGSSVAYGEIFAANATLGLPITAIWGPVVSYNVMVLASFVLTAFGTYLWVHHLTGSRAAALVAGTIAGFLPYRFAHAPGHMHMMTTQWMPLSLYAFERFRESSSMRWAVGLGFMLGLVGLSSWYYAYSVALLMPVYIVLRARPWRAYWRRSEWWGGLLVAALVAAVLVLPFFLPYARLMGRGEMTRQIGEMESWSINFYDFFIPNLLNPIVRPHADRWFPVQIRMWVEQGVALGYVALLLGVIGVLRHRRHEAFAAVAVLWLVSYSIALGPTLHAGDRQVRIPVPRIATAGLERALSVLPASTAGPREQIVTRRSIGVPMPSLFLYLFVPGTSGMRVMSRFGIWTGLMTAALAGLGVAALLTGRRRFAGWALAGGLMALVLVESRSLTPGIDVRPREVDRWLASRPTRSVIVELPLEQTYRTFQDYYQTVNHQYYLFGPVTSFYPPIRARRDARLRDFPSPDSVAALREWSVDFVLLTPSEIPDWPRVETALEALPGLALEGRFGDVLVYRPAPVAEVQSPAGR
jgi:hypothetical protein